jgi:hypothetical protein
MSGTSSASRKILLPLNRTWIPPCFACLTNQPQLGVNRSRCRSHLTGNGCISSAKFGASLHAGCIRQIRGEKC